ncbi:MAG: cysteine desulfurase [Alphaproteobacteria bacterium]|nr:MAG: cysteine desulfurase [Alphaproteobacteria bacterium]
MVDLLWEWLNFAVRWLHVITGIAWIGSSFYFIALDLSLKQRDGLPAGVQGDTWQVHGGGFYHMMKYTVAPPRMPEDLTWFKWESYWTWLSGAFLLGVLYYGSSELFLIDRQVADLEPWQAILIGIGGIVLGYTVYEGLCRSPLGANDYALYAVLFVFVVAVGWGFTQIFSGRGAFIHVGALIATIMTANVAHVIIPNQRKTVAALKAGEAPDPKWGKQAKQRSTHNNYITLPVVFLMLSNHYPLAFATKYNWAIIGLVLLTGFTIRHFFNSMHAGKGKPWWTWAATAILFILIMWLSQAGPPQRDAVAAARPAVAERLMASAEFEAVREIVTGRCSMCHAREPVWEGIARAPRHVFLEEDDDIARHAEQIYAQAARSDAMPPGNLTGLEAVDREVLARWYEGATGQRRHLLW